MDAALDRVLSHFGGISAVVGPDQQALLKPNFVSPSTREACATTDPAIIGGVIRQVLKAGGRPMIGDSPAFGSTRSVAKKSGAWEVARQHQVPFVELNRAKSLAVTTALTPHGLVVDRTAHEVDRLFNLPKLKAHCQLTMTGAVKNLYGCVPGKRKPWRHVRSHHSLSAFCDMLVENARQLAPELTIVDAVMAMEREGPRFGDPKPLGLIIVGDDPVAVDVVLCAVVGLPPERYEILNAARRRDVGAWSWDRIQLAGVPLAEARDPSFKLPELIVDISFDIPRLIKSTLKQFVLRQRDQWSEALREIGIYG